MHGVELGSAHIHSGRKPKAEKKKSDKVSDQVPVPKNKKGFLPETKKRKKRNKPVLEPAAADPADAHTPGADDAAPARKKHDKKAKRKRPADGAAASQPNPAKKSKTQPESNKSKKKKKPKQKKEGGGQM